MTKPGGTNLRFAPLCSKQHDFCACIPIDTRFDLYVVYQMRFYFVNNHASRVP